jgi:transketolase
MSDEIIANAIRYDLVKHSQLTGTPHLACCLSAVDILVQLYWHNMNINPKEPSMPNRDLFFLGKGHAAMLLYATLAHRGFFEPALLAEHGKDGSIFEEHPGIDAPPGVEHVSGSLGHALGLAVGNAIAAKIKGLDRHHYVLIGDGESNEGSIWEAAMMAPAHNLDNVTVIMDFNKLQGTGRSCEIMCLEPMEDRWRSFGWNTFRISGHDFKRLDSALSLDKRVSGKPTAIIADTIKGNGVSFMADDNNWHYRIPTADEVLKVGIELGVITK